MSRNAAPDAPDAPAPTLSLDEPAVAALLDWFAACGVAYPWTETADPWAVWVSEIMLQQTTVGAVGPRYRRWMERFPTPEALAAADDEEILREWEGLGYYSRARNLAAAAREVADSGGGIPGDSRSLRALPGVGEYTAAAVASLAFGERIAAVDANGRRIAQRLTASEEWTAALDRAFRAALEARMPADAPGRLNAAVMQLGQLVCTPREPDCPACPLAPGCAARKRGLQGEIPRRRRRETVRLRTPLALLVWDDAVLLARKAEGIAAGLWIFPPEAAVAFPGGRPEPAAHLAETVHAYTRFRETLAPAVFPARGDETVEEAAETAWAGPEDLAGKPMPTAYRGIAGELAGWLEQNRRRS